MKKEKIFIQIIEVIRSKIKEEKELQKIEQFKQFIDIDDIELIKKHLLTIIPYKDNFEKICSAYFKLNGIEIEEDKINCVIHLLTHLIDLVT